MTAAAKSTMPALFRRLRAVGYDRAFLRRAVLPDWWEDSLASDPGIRWQIELRIAQRLSLPVAAVSDPSRPLPAPKAVGARLRRAKKGADVANVAPAMVAARNLVRVLLPHLPPISNPPAGLSAVDFRARILACGCPVDLAGLVHVCWESGIAVFHLGTFPQHAKKFAGMAYYEGRRPVIVLGSGYDAPPRLAFYLAHEVAHILRGHVKPGQAALVDSDLEKADDEDRHELEADGDALEILTGGRDPSFPVRVGMTAPKLAQAAQRYGSEHGIHAGTVALIYGKTANRMPVAVSALKRMNMDSGGRAIIASGLERRLKPRCLGAEGGEELPGSAEEVLPLFGIECAC